MEYFQEIFCSFAYNNILLSWPVTTCVPLLNAGSNCFTRNSYILQIAGHTAVLTIIVRTIHINEIARFNESLFD